MNISKQWQLSTFSMVVPVLPERQGWWQWGVEKPEGEKVVRYRSDQLPAGSYVSGLASKSQVTSHKKKTLKSLELVSGPYGDHRRTKNML